jgi:hypothetical protein
MESEDEPSRAQWRSVRSEVVERVDAEFHHDAAAAVQLSEQVRPCSMVNNEHESVAAQKTALCPGLTQCRDAVR